jgi:ATP-dependent DNA helicase RecG
MKLSLSNSSNKSSPISWGTPISQLFGKASIKTVEKLNNVGIRELSDLLWTFPLRVIELPPLRSFDFIEEGKIFIGRAKVLNIQARPNFRVRGRGKAMLYNVSVHIQDTLSQKIISLKWFNTYGSVNQKISQCTYIEFMGTASAYNGQIQFTNPDFFSIGTPDGESNFVTVSNELKIQYPTVNSIPGIQIKKIIDKIPAALWNMIPDTLPASLLQRKNLLSLSESFKVIHAKIKPNAELDKKAEYRLIYEEFFEDQLKIHLRREFYKKPKAQSFSITEKKSSELQKLFPFLFTIDQVTTIREIQADLKGPHPMMRLIQGDVGCGKTAVAMIAALTVMESGAQAALMCPTEALALQHFIGSKELFGNEKYRIILLLGSTPAKEKKLILKELADGQIDFIIGTHALIQEAVQFNDLGLAIIDEQHKFGVDQRIKLTSKTPGSHCLIMSATPIPRSLSLTQYGDLDISTIKAMPLGRKGHKTRIVTKDTFQQFLSFIKTRLSLNEQVYIVVPAIIENPEQDFHNLENILDRFKQYFPQERVQGLHGQMKSDEKMKMFTDFKDHKIDILVSTSVIEVGINVINATIMAIMNPERFGLSSLHQLRGRVGRGEKPGFCFLVNDKEISATSMERLKVIENNTDGFKIAEEDLRIRGEGDLFGTEQSGSESKKRLANIVLHSDILNEARTDALQLIETKDPHIQLLLEKFSKDDRIFTTA